MSSDIYRLFENRRYWIFDLDGTLTLPIHDFAYIRRELDIPETYDILEHLGSLEPPESARRHTLLDDIERRLAENAVAAHGLSDLLELLSEFDFHLGILMRNSREIAMMTLDVIGARSYFNDTYVLGRDDAPPKPDPSGIHYLLDQWGADSGQVVMVGDYLFDLQAGRNAGTATVHVGRPDAKRWPDVTDLAVENLADLAEMLVSCRDY
ncbi:MAG: HAD-IA family hydrolase [Desulfuromonadaceae bacterium]|nr:HAD-IA family hydrolase [Desulfuromonadaceae bacterium]